MQTETVENENKRLVHISLSFVPFFVLLLKWLHKMVLNPTLNSI